MLYQAYQAHADIMGPVRKFAGDRIQNMQFQIGTSF